MRKVLVVLSIFMALTACQTTSHQTNKQTSFTEPPEHDTYNEAVSSWTSYKDVAGWMTHNFRYSNRGVVVTTPERLYKRKVGHCIDAANFITRTLNKISPEYKAKSIFIDNLKSGNKHWATYFKINGKKYVMDFGAGPKWSSMNGLHGPLANLNEYQRFLGSLWINNFEVGELKFRDPEKFLTID